MYDAEKVELAKKTLRFCPECGIRLEAHPNVECMISCYFHGDFLIRWTDEGVTIHWRRMDVPTMPRRVRESFD